MVNAIPTANTNRAGFVVICSPHGKQSRPLGRIVRAKSAEMCELPEAQECARPVAHQQARFDHLTAETTRRYPIARRERRELDAAYPVRSRCTQDAAVAAATARRELTIAPAATKIVMRAAKSMARLFKRCFVAFPHDEPGRSAPLHFADDGLVFLSICQTDTRWDRRLYLTMRHFHIERAIWLLLVERAIWLLM
jgi:hypothetical protein